MTGSQSAGQAMRKRLSTTGLQLFHEGKQIMYVIWRGSITAGQQCNNVTRDSMMSVSSYVTDYDYSIQGCNFLCLKPYFTPTYMYRTVDLLQRLINLCCHGPTK